MKMEKYAQLTEEVIALDRDELSDNLNLLDRCVEELERKNPFLNPKRVSLILVPRRSIG